MTTHTSTCPSAETLAQYLDGSLSPSERAEVEAHIAACEDCFEQVAAVAVLETEGEHAAAARGAEIKRLPPPRSRWLAAAAAAVLVLGIGWWSWTAADAARRQAAAASLAWAERLGGEQDLRAAVTRGWSDEGQALAFGGSLPPEKRGFRLGVHLLDARTAAAADDDAGWHEALDAAAPLLPREDDATAERLAHLREREDVSDRREELERLAVSARRVDPMAFDLGAWTEAGRLAAMSGKPDLLANPAYQAQLDEFLRRPLDGRDVNVQRELTAIRDRLRERSSSGELSELARAFETIILKH